MQPSVLGSRYRGYSLHHGSALGPAPFCEIVRDFQFVVKPNVNTQISGKLPDAVMACIGGGSMLPVCFYPFVNDKSVAMYGAEASGLGFDTENTPQLCQCRPGIRSNLWMLQDAHGQIMEAF